MARNAMKREGVRGRSGGSSAGRSSSTQGLDTEAKFRFPSARLRRRRERRPSSPRVEQLQTVYAHRDDGYMAGWSRWRPRKVFCTFQPDHSDGTPVEHVVKYRQRRPGHPSYVGASALISEVVCGGLLQAGGINVLERRLVHVSVSFADSYGESDIGYAVAPGLHFGTVRRYDVENGPPPRLERLAEPQQVIDLAVFDTWLCNIDRELEGNTLLFQQKQGLFGIIASDQSDCFCGSGPFADGTWLDMFHRRGLGSPLKLFDQAMLHCGPTAFDEALVKVRAAVQQINRVVEEVPQEWWSEARVEPRAVETAVRDRASKIEDIMDGKRWRNLQEAIRGGHVL